MKVLKFAFLLWLMFSFFEGMGQASIIESISVINQEGHVRVRWSEPNPELTEKFSVLRLINGTFVALDTIYDGSALEWIDLNAPSNDSICLYVVDNFRGSGYSEPKLQSILLNKTVIYNECELKNTIRWSEYQITNFVSSYRISVSIDGGTNFQQLEEIQTATLTPVLRIQQPYYTSPDSTISIYEYTHENIVPNEIYHYKIEALVNGVSENVFSNIVSKESPAYVRPNPPEIVRVSVNESSGYVDITYETSITDLNLSKNIVITRNDPTGSGETPIPLTFPPTSYMVSDENVFTETTSYIYELELTDNCFNPVPDPVKHRTILLEGNIDPEFSVSLNWNGYEGWDVIEQKLYRKQGTETPVELVTLFLGENSHIDDVSALPNREALFQYYLVAYGSDQNVQFSRSNTLSLQPDFDPVMPNAFYPGSSKTENTTFKPVITFYNSTNYILQIYNRWGAVIWETNDPDEGWTGKNNSGKLQPMGVYVYLLQYEEAAGLVRTKRGTVSLIH
ncbi:MAG: gliding motility-associated C-terminal domain-containing protein [Bacteroidetes bacterium]|nr:gliding motility-associated C-terminal domain-containing protein [Bacteroidota bacterium]